ncbi:hypothetical protein AB6A40_003551 [Gnathostoma spinigerum]|uniref:Uncharacterized protein n=1 Tax=Gnathostoma spinigerum TaxID=75299 RepID=A0ABD6EC57_9BILA
MEADSNENSGFIAELTKALQDMRRAMTNGQFSFQNPVSRFMADDFCVKTCGMEDIQFAAKEIGKMMAASRVCFVLLTVISIACMLSLTISIVRYLSNRKDFCKCTRKLYEAIELDSSTTFTTAQVKKPDYVDRILSPKV